MLGGADSKKLFFTENARGGLYRKQLLHVNMLGGVGPKKPFPQKVLGEVAIKETPQTQT